MKSTENRRERARQLIFTMSVIVVTTTLLLTILSAYSTILGFERQLLEKQNAVKHLILAVGEFDQINSQHTVSGGAVAATLTQITRAYEAHSHDAGRTEFVMAEHVGDELFFIRTRFMPTVKNAVMRPSRYGLEQPEYVQQWDAITAEPIKRALDGRTGTLWARDYRGIFVLAAHTPIKIGDKQFGIVIKIDAASIVVPIIEAFVLVMLLGAAGIYFGSRRFLGLINPLIDELEEKNQANETMIRTSPSGIVMLEQDSRISKLNLAALALFGYSAEELTGQSITRLMSPEMAKKFAPTFARFVGTPERHSSGVRAEVIAIHHNGSEIPVHLDIGVINLTKGIRLVGIISDLRPQKAIEATLRNHRDELQREVRQASAEIRAIIETAVSGIITISSRGIIQSFNPAAERLFGWTSTEAIGQNVSILMDAHSAAQHDGFLSDFLRTGHAKVIGTGREVMAKRKNGSPFPAHLAVGHAVVSESNQFFVGYITDISTQKAHEQELEKARDDAEAGLRAKTAFISNISHEIRTPMNAIRGFVELLTEDTSLNESQASTVAQIRRASLALGSLFENILKLARVESDTAVRPDKSFPLDAVFNGLISEVSPSARKAGLEIAMRLDPKIPACVVGDPGWVMQLLLLLLDNAVKFTREGLITLGAVAGPVADEVILTVEDTGIGMAPEVIATIFEPFTQGDESTTRHFGGVGLGMTIAKRLVDSMGGTIQIDSEPGKGTCISISIMLPACPDSTGKKQALIDPMPAGNGSTYPPHPTINYAAAGRWTRALLAALDAHDLIAAESLVNQDVVGLTKAELAVISDSLADFEFELARERVMALAKRHDIRIT